MPLSYLQEAFYIQLKNRGLYMVQKVYKLMQTFRVR